MLTPIPSEELQQNESVEAKSYIPFDKEHYLINVFKKNWMIYKIKKFIKNFLRFFFYKKKLKL